MCTVPYVRHGPTLLEDANASLSSTCMFSIHWGVHTDISIWEVSQTDSVLLRSDTHKGTKTKNAIHMLSSWVCVVEPRCIVFALIKEEDSENDAQTVHHLPEDLLLTEFCKDAPNGKCWSRTSGCITWSSSRLYLDVNENSDPDCVENSRSKKQSSTQRASLASQLFSAVPPPEAVKALVPIMMSVRWSNQG